MSADPLAPSPLLSVRNACHQYQHRFTSLQGVSMDVYAGERLALLGPNGCGKSTLLKVLDGLEYLDSGSYAAFGAEVTEDALEDEGFNREFRSRVGFVFQHSDTQVFSATVREEVAFGPRNMGLDDDTVAQRVQDTLELLELGPLADRAPYQLSGGQKKRVAIASVLSMGPRVLLFDEPTAALDPRTQHWLLDLIDTLHQSGTTIVTATHDLESLTAMADRCVLLGEDHRVWASGPPETLLHNPDLLLEANLIHHHSRFAVHH